MRVRLTDVVVRNAKPKSATYRLEDEVMPGFGLRIGKNRKTWVVTFGSDRKRVSLGSYPVMGLGDARDAARMLLAQNTLGKKHSPVKFGEALGAYYDLHLRPNTRKSTSNESERILNKEFLPVFGLMKLTDITMRDISGCLDRITGLAMRIKSYGCIKV